MIEGAPWTTWPAYRRTYIASAGIFAFSIRATAHTTSDGFWWLLNLTTSNVRIYLRRVDFTCQIGSALATPTSPRVRLERMSFTGSPTGPAVTPARAFSDAPGAAGTLRLTNGGISAGVASWRPFHSFLPVATLNASGAVAASAQVYAPDAPIELMPGEGVVCRQADAGTASDTRRFVVTVHWSEIAI